MGDSKSIKIEHVIQCRQVISMIWKIKEAKTGRRLVFIFPVCEWKNVANKWILSLKKSKTDMLRTSHIGRYMTLSKLKI